MVSLSRRRAPRAALDVRDGLERSKNEGTGRFVDGKREARGVETECEQCESLCEGCVRVW